MLNTCCEKRESCTIHGTAVHMFTNPQGHRLEIDTFNFNFDKHGMIFFILTICSHFTKINNIFPKNITNIDRQCLCEVPGYMAFTFMQQFGAILLTDNSNFIMLCEKILGSIQKETNHKIIPFNYILHDGLPEDQCTEGLLIIYQQFFHI